MWTDLSHNGSNHLQSFIISNPFSILVNIKQLKEFNKKQKKRTIWKQRRCPCQYYAWCWRCEDRTYGHWWGQAHNWKTCVTKTYFRRAGERTPRRTSSVREQIFWNSRGSGGHILSYIVGNFIYIHVCKSFF